MILIPPPASISTIPVSKTVKDLEERKRKYQKCPAHLCLEEAGERS